MVLQGLQYKSAC